MIWNSCATTTAYSNPDNGDAMMRIRFFISDALEGESNGLRWIS